MVNEPQIGLLQLADIDASIKRFLDCLASRFRDALHPLRLRHETVRGDSERVMIVFAHEDACLTGNNGFGNTAVPRGDDRRTTGHCFQHGIRNAFAVAIRC